MPIFLKYGDIKGEVKEEAHAGYIELQSAQLPGGRPNGPNVTETTVTKITDSSSTHLHREAISGRGVKAVIDFVREDGSVYLRVEMEETLISSISVSAGGDRPTESLTLNFTSIVFTNIPGEPPP